MAKYGLWEFGEGTGKHSPETKRTQRENDILAVALRKAEKVYGNKIFQRKIHGGGYQRSGIPDIYVAMYKNIHIWVEFKRPGADTTALQKKNLEILKRLGAYCGTAESYVTYLKIIEDVLEEERKKNK